MGKYTWWTFVSTMGKSKLNIEILVPRFPWRAFSMSFQFSFDLSKIFHSFPYRECQKNFLWLARSFFLKSGKDPEGPLKRKRKLCMLWLFDQDFWNIRRRKHFENHPRSKFSTFKTKKFCLKLTEHSTNLGRLPIRVQWTNHHSSFPLMLPSYTVDTN